MLYVTSRTRRKSFVALLVMAMISALLSPFAAAERPGDPGGPVAAAGAVADPDAGRFVGLDPSRVIDTRPDACIPAGQTRKVQITGEYGVPEHVSAVMLNLTVVGAPGSGYLTVWGDGERPTASNLNHSAGQTIANAVTTAVGADGSITLFASGPGCTQVVVDVNGYYTAGDGGVIGGGLVMIPRQRLIDTRKDAGSVCAPGGLVLEIDDHADADSVVVNVTVTNATRDGYLTVYPDGVARPTTSNLNYRAGQTIANQVTVKLGDDDGIGFFAYDGCPDVIVDIAGYYTDGAPAVGGFVGITPDRLLDTRKDGAWPCPTPGSSSSSSLTIAGVGDVPEFATGVVLNTTVVAPRVGGHLTVWPKGPARPGTSSLNFTANQTVPNQVVMGLGDDGAISMFANSGCPHVLLDVAGYFVGEAPVDPVVIVPATTSHSTTAGAAFTATLVADGGEGGYTWEVVGDTELPSWLDLDDETGVISGTSGPDDAGEVTFDVAATDSENNGSGPTTVTITVLSAVVANDVSKVTVIGDDLGVTLSATGGTDTFSWDLVGDPVLPDWLDLSALDEGSIGGVATGIGHFSFDVVATDGNGGSDTATIDIEVVDGVVVTSSGFFATVGAEFDQTLTASGGDGSYEWTYTDAPDWLDLDERTGELSGTPEAADVDDPEATTFTVAATSRGITSAERSITISVRPAVVANDVDEKILVDDDGLEIELEASGGDGNFTWAVAHGSTLPAWLDLVDGVLTVKGDASPVLATPPFDVVATDGGGRTDTATVTISVYEPVVVTTSSAFHIDVEVIEFTGLLEATGGDDDFTWALADGSTLPTWLDLDDGVLTIADGKAAPDQATTVTFDVIATSQGFHSEPTRITIEVEEPLSIAQSSFEATAGDDLDIDLVATGGDGDFSWELDTDGPALPPGWSFDDGNLSAEDIDANANASGSYSFDVVLSDGQNRSFTTTIVVSVKLLVDTTVHVVTTSEDPFEWEVRARGVTGADPAGYTWSLASGETLPVDWGFAEEGILNGYFTAPGSETLTIIAMDSYGNVSDPTDVTVTAHAPVTVANQSFNASAGVAFSAQLVANGGDGSYTWTLAEGSGLPFGWFLDPSGTISGTPAAEPIEDVVFDVVARDSNGFTADDATISIRVSPKVVVTSSIFDVTVGGVLSETLAAIGGSGSYTWALADGEPALPAWLALNAATGGLSGMPTSEDVGEATFDVIATDGNLLVSDATTITVIVHGAVEVQEVSFDGTVGVPFAGSIGVSGGDGEFTWSVGGQLPDGVGFVDGELSGTPTAEEIRTFTVTVGDGNGVQDTATITIDVRNPVTVSSTEKEYMFSQLTAPNHSFDWRPGASGGDGTYEWALAEGYTLPTNWSLSTSGQIFGRFTSAGTSVTIEVVVSDGVGRSSGDVAITIHAYDGVEITTTDVDVTDGHGFSTQLVATGGDGDFEWSDDGHLPEGWVLTVGGLLTGTASDVETVSITVTATDGGGAGLATDTATITIHVHPAPNIDSTPVHVITGEEFSTTFDVSGGFGTLTWALVSDPAPHGWSISTDGVLSGSAPAALGPVTVEVSVTDTNGASDTATVTVNVYPEVEAATKSVSATAGTQFTLQLTATGGNGNHTWAIAGGSSLPDGWSLDDQTGVVSGTPTIDDVGEITFEVVATDGNEFDSEPALITVNVHTVVTVDDDAVDATVGDTLAVVLSASGGDVDHDYDWSAAGLEGDWTVVEGVLVGTISEAGTFVVTVTARDDNGATGTGTVTIEVDLAVTTTSFDVPTSDVDDKFRLNLGAAGGDGEYTWTEIGSALPTTVKMFSDGEIYGYMETAGVITFTVRVTDGDGHRSAETQITINVRDAHEITSASTFSTNMDAGVDDLSFALEANGGNGQPQWSIEAVDPDPVPTWLELSDGHLVVDPGAVGMGATFPMVAVVDVTVTDETGLSSDTRTVTVTLYDSVRVGFDPSGDADNFDWPTDDDLYCVLDGVCAVTVTAIGGNGEFPTWIVEVTGDDGDASPQATLTPTSGPGNQDTAVRTLSFNTDSGDGGLAAGTYVVSVTIEDSDGYDDTQTFGIALADAIGVESTSVEWTIGVTGAAQLVGAGGHGDPYEFQETGGSSDFWEIDAHGEITYTGDEGALDPDETYVLYIEVVDGRGNTSGTITVDIDVVPTPIGLTAAGDGLVGTTLYCVEQGPCELEFEATGGNGTFTDGWTVTVGGAAVGAPDLFVSGGDDDAIGTLTLNGRVAEDFFTVTVAVADTNGSEIDEPLSIDVEVGPAIGLTRTSYTWLKDSTADISLTAIGGSGEGFEFTIDPARSDTNWTVGGGGVVSYDDGDGGAQPEADEQPYEVYVVIVDSNGSVSASVPVQIQVNDPVGVEATAATAGILVDDVLYCVVDAACAMTVTASGGSGDFPTWSTDASDGEGDRVTLDPADGDDATRTVSFSTDAQGLVHGDYVVTVTATDDSGIAEATDTMTFTVHVGPAMALTPAVSNWGLIGNDNITKFDRNLTPLAVDGVNVDLDDYDVEVVARDAGGECFDVEVHDDGPVQWHLTCPFASKPAPGSYEITVKVTERATDHHSLIVLRVNVPDVD